MLKDRLASHAAGTRENVHDAGRKDVLQELREFKNGERRVRSRLDHYRIAGSERRGELPAGHQVREVPRNDLTHNAERLVKHEGERVFVNLGGTAFGGAQNAGEVAEVIGTGRNIDIAGLTEGLAVIEHFHRGKTLNVRVDRVRDLQKQSGTLSRRRLAPGLERFSSDLDRAVHVFRGRGRHIGELFAVCRTHGRESLSVRGRHEFVIDE